MISGRKGMALSLVGILIAAVAAIFLFSKAANVYLKKGPELGQRAGNVFSESDAPPPVVSPRDAEGVLSSMKSQINAATEKEHIRSEALQSMK